MPRIVSIIPTVVAITFLLFTAGGSGDVLHGQDRTLSPEQFEEASLQYRTALHYDPLLESQLDNLIRLYREADRIDELIGLYQSHIEQYPDDAGAKSVLIQILRREKRDEAGELITSAVNVHPQFPALQFLLFRFLEEKGDARALEALSKAIDLEPNPARRSQWLEELLQLSEGDEARVLAGAQLNKLLLIEGQTALSFLSLAKLMQRYLFWDLSLEALARATAAGLTPDGEVDAGVMRATALRETGKDEEAAAILDGLLSRLASDHWRRREILSMRLSVVATDEQRAEILDRFRQAYEAAPQSESAALDYAEMLLASEKQSEAIRVILEASASLSSSTLIESRALELLTSGNDPVALEQFLEERLEIDPGRADLRFQLVKVRYALKKDAEAEQDFKVVVAGLEPSELSERILELQRYLRSIERIEAAAMYLQRYVRNYPDRLDVARELAEVYISRESFAEIDPLISRLEVSGAPTDTVSDLAGFLMGEGFYAAASVILKTRLVTDPDNFELGLMQIKALGELGESAAVGSVTPRMRELADSPGRYARWLDAAVSAHTQLETLDSFFANEQARFSFDEGKWPEDKVEKFILLCEAGKLKLQVESMAQAVRSQLADGTFDAALKTRLRRFLVGMLEADPAASVEVEEQLRALAAEDVPNRAEYDLQRALLYHRTQRIDLAQDLFTTIAYSEINTPQILQEAVEVLVNYGFLHEAAEALKVVNQLLPEDVFSWEKRLTLLATLNRESDFRAVIRSLRSGDARLSLRADSLALLEDHLQASFWRTVSRLIATGDPARFEETLPLLASVDREDQSLAQAAWTEWTRAIVLRTLGRETEAKEALSRLSTILSGQKLAAIQFPDGLTLNAESAPELVNQSAKRTEVTGGVNAADLLSRSEVGWAFEVEPGARIEQFGTTQSEALVLDNRGTVYSLDRTTGKLLWRERLAPGGMAAGETRPELFITRVGENQDADLEVKTVRPFLIGKDYFFILSEGELKSHYSANGSLRWSATLPPAGTTAADTPMTGARPDTLMAMDGDRLVLFRPDEGLLLGFDVASGKQLWERSIISDEPAGKLSSLNAGLDVGNGRVFAYGWQSVVLDADTGIPFWRFDQSAASTFPVTLRKERGDAAAETMEPSRILTQRDRIIDFTRPDLTSGFLSSLENESLSMVSPAVYWTRERLLSGVESYGVLSDGFLWLMQGKALRRLSLRLPVASRQLPASGTLVGIVRNHAWFLDGQELHHLDFNTERVSRLNLTDLGPHLRAVLSGNQLVVRGAAGTQVVNALTGRLIGSHPFPPALLAHLRAVTQVRPEQARSSSLWRGTVYRPDNGEPRYCLPIKDTISDRDYLTGFGGNVLVSLQPPSNPVTANGESNND